MIIAVSITHARCFSLMVQSIFSAADHQHRLHVKAERFRELTFQPPFRYFLGTRLRLQHSSDSRGITHLWVILYTPFVQGKWFMPDVSVGEQDELHSTDSRGITHPWVIW